MRRLADRNESWSLIAVSPPAETGSVTGVPEADVRFVSVYGGVPDPALRGPEPGAQVEVTVRFGDDQFTTTVPLDHGATEAVRVAAEQLQDHVIESAWGQPRPPCPGHGHPLSVAVTGETVLWRCPRDANHHSEPIGVAQ